MKIYILEEIDLVKESSYSIYDLTNKRYLYKEISKNILYGILGSHNIKRFEFGQDTFDIDDDKIFINYK